MNVRSLKYFILEGFRSFLINGLMSVASVITVTLCLIIFGIYVLFSVNINHAANQIEANFEIRVFINEGTPVSRTAQMGEDIKTVGNVSDAVFVSKMEALQEWKKEFGEGSEILDGLDMDNPLRDSYKVTVTDLKSVHATVEEIGKISDVAYIKNNKETMDKLVNITSVVKSISFWFTIFFALISVFIISNAIRITVFARRREVNIMKFVGATDVFISFPFMVEGIIIGVLGAFASVLLVSQGYEYLFGYIGMLFGTTISLFKMSDMIWLLIASLSGMGIILGAVGSIISLRRHLHV